MNILECKQGSEDWYCARAAKPTASKADKLITPTGRMSTQSAAYMNRLLAEHIDYEEATAFDVKTRIMERGNELEPQARELYETITGHQVTEVGGIWFDDDQSALCSPDGLILSKEKGLEIKCPLLTTHVENVRAGEIPKKYILQVQTAMAFTGYKEWDFMSYHPSYKPMICTVSADEVLIKKIKDAFMGFIAALNHEKSVIDEYKKRSF